MPVYKLDNEIYNIPNDVVSDFEKDNPSASISYMDGDDEYEIPLNKRDGFVKSFPKAKLKSDGLPPKYLQRSDEAVGSNMKPTTNTAPQDPSDYDSFLAMGRKELEKRSGGAMDVMRTDAVASNTLPQSVYKPQIDNPRSVNTGRDMEEKIIDSRVERVGKLPNTSDRNILENYNNRYAMTGEGGELRDSIERKKLEVSDRLVKEYLSSDLYKELSSHYTGKDLDEKANEEFNRVYGGKIEEELAPMHNEYREKMFSRYGDQLESDVTGLAKENTVNQVANLKEEVKRGIDVAYREWNGKQAEYESNHPFLSALSGVRSGSNTKVATPTDDKKFNDLSAAMNLLDESDKIITEANKNGSSGALLRGVRDEVFDVDTWTAGITDLTHASSLRNAAEKSERGEKLLPEEQKLLEAAAVNMATNAYFASDLSRMYRAGQTTGASIPFMLEFALNPVSGSGNAIAKGILKYGLKKFGTGAGKYGLKNALLTGGKKMAARLASDAVAATAMTATTGVGRVGTGTQERMMGDVNFDFNEDGRIEYAGRENQMEALEAFGKATASTTIENFSEMFFNAFKGGEKVVGDAIEKVSPKGVNELLAYTSKMKPVQLYKELKNNSMLREVAQRTQFHGLFEEHLEEVVGNLMHIPLGEMTLEQTVDLDNNIDILTGLAPTSIAFGALGLGGLSVQSYRTRKNIERLGNNMTPEQKAILDDVVLQSNNDEKVKNSIRNIVLNKELSEGQKKNKIAYLYNSLQEKVTESVRNAETDEAIEKEVADIVNSSNQADGIFTECNRITTNEIGEIVLVPGNITGWMGEQPLWKPMGAKPTDDAIALKDSEYDPVSIQSMSTKDMINATEEMMREEARDKAEREAKYSPEVLSPGNAPQNQGIYFTVNGKNYVTVGGVPEGFAYSELDEKGKEIRNWATSDIESPITEEDYYDAMQAQLDAREESANIQPEVNEVSENPLGNEGVASVDENMMGSNEVDTASEVVAPVDESIQEQKPVFPVDEKGNTLYHKMPVEDTIVDLTDGTLDDNEIDGFIEANKAEAGKLLKKVSESAPKISTNKVKYLADKRVWQEKVADAQAQVDYWNSVNEEIAASRVQPGDKTAEAILSMGEPMNGDELAAMMLGTGRLPILYGSYKKETGGRNAEARGMVGLFASKANGGMSIEEAGEQLMLADQENGTNFFDSNDPNAGRNAIIDILSGARTRGDLFGFIQRNREVMAERERQAELNAYEQTIAKLAEASRMTPEEFITFEENIAQMLEERLKDVSDEELKGIFAELYLEDNERSRESNEVGTGVPEGEERAGSNEGSPGILSEEWSDDAGASERSTKQPNGNIETGEPGNSVLPEAATVAGRKEVAPVFEKEAPTSIDKTTDTGENQSDLQSDTALLQDVSTSSENKDLEVQGEKQISVGNIFDRQGNPVNENGNLIVEKIDRIEQLTDEDFNTPSRSVQLPLVPSNVSEAIGSGSKPVIIKKNIFEKNRNTHNELTPDKSRNILAGALYSPNIIGQVQPVKRPNYWVAIETVDKNSVVVLEVDNKKDNVEIVGWRLVDAKGLEKMKRQAEREGGQFLIQTSTNDAAAALSTLPSDLSSENKDSKFPDNKQEKRDFVAPEQTEGESILDYASRIDESKRVHDAGKEVDTNPTEAQKEAGNYKKGHIKIDGFDITIENPKGTVRSGVDADGKPWSITMNNTYGYIRGTEGVDGDHIDVFLGDGGSNVYVVDQVNQDGSFDEHKVMYGFNLEEEARDAYLANYSPGWNRLGNITEVSKEVFREWVDSSHRKTKPFVEYKIAKSNQVDDGKRFRIVHHGGGSSFSKFSTDYIDTGEGNQSFGWGLYFTDKKDIAQYYSETIGGMPSYILYKNGQRANMDDQISRIIYNFDGSVKRALASNRKILKALEKEGDEELASEVRKTILQLEKEGPKDWKLKEEGNRYLYDVEIPDSGFLHWDKAVADEQKEQIIQQANKEGVSFSFYGDIVTPEDYFQKSQPEGFQIYKMLSIVLGGEKEASMFLNRAGFNGIEYVAGRHSRKYKISDSNFVVFDENAVSIINQLRYRSEENGIDEVNERFNEELNKFTEENADKIHFNLGMPSVVLISAGITEKPMKLYGNKVIKKMKKHGFSLSELRNLPKAVANPIAVFDNLRRPGNRSILIELQTKQGHFLITVDLGKGEDVDFNIISSTFGKAERNIVDWLKRGLASYINKEKALNYLHHPALNAETLNSQELSSTTKIVESFENPTIEQGKIVSEVEALSNSLHAPVRIVKSVDELTESDSARNRIEKGNRVKGWFDIKSQEVVVYLPHAVSVEDANETVLHEVVGHYGLRKMFGEDFDAFLDNVYVNASTEVRKGIVDRANRKGNILDLREATEEYLAELAERGFENAEERSLWQKIKDAFVELLRKAGIELGFELTDNELRYILWKSYQNLESPSIMDRAADVDMQNRLGVGEFGIREEDTEREKSRKGYEQSLNVVNEFTERHAGTGSVFVIRSKEMLRKQLEVINVVPEDIDKYELWMQEGNIPAFFAPKYGRIIVLDSNLPKEELNAYLWHESTHKSLRDLFGDKLDEEILKAYEVLRADENFIGLEDYIRDLYAGDAEETIREECVVYLFEALYEQYGEDALGRNLSVHKDGVKNKFFQKLYNQIVYGTEATVPRGNIGRNVQPGNEELPSEMEMRYSDGDSKQQEAGGRGRDELRGLYRDEAEGVSGKRFRTGESTEEEREPDGTIEAYETALKKQGFRAQEAYQDSMLALKVFQDVVLAKDGGKLKSFEDSYKAENRMSSVSTREKEVFSKVFLNPIITEVARLIKEEDATYRDITGYLIAKHGLERNIVLRERKASEAADKAVKERIDSVTREHRKGHMSEDEYNSVINEANLKRNEVYQKELEKNANKDYSGLTGLMENFADEKDGNFTSFAEQFVSDFESKHNIKELWTLINKATSQTLKKSYESGLMSLEQYESLKGRFKNYVPLRGWDETMADEVYEYLDKMRSPVNSLLKSADGRKSLADDPIATIGNMADSTILQGNRNVMKQNFLNFVINHPSDLAQVKDMWYAKDNVSGDFVPSFPNIPENATAEDIANIVSEHEENMKFLEKDGLAKRGMNELGLSYKILPYQKSEHIVSMKRNGKDVVVYINGNPRVAQALNGLTNPDVESNAILSGLGKLNRILAANFTTRNPAFVLSNLSRDLIFSTSAVAVKESPLYLARFSTNIPKSIAAVFKGIRRNGGTSEADKYFQEFLDNGGETGYANLTDVDKYKKMIQKEVKHLTKKDYFKLVRQGLELFGDFNRMAEDIARFNTYMTSRQEGRSIVEAINDAKEITVNFNKKGAGYKSINKLAPWYAPGNVAAYSAGIFKNLYLFFNAGIQSLFNFNSLYKKNWKKFGGLLGGFTAAGFLIPLVNSLFQSIGGDGDDEDYYANLSEWTRRNNLCLYIPSSKGHFITIPLPIELRAFYGLGDMAYQQTIGNGGKKGTEIAYDAVNQLTELLPLNPLGNNGDVVATIVPDVFKPLWQVMKNEDFTGRPIYKKNSFNETMPEWTKTYKGTSKWLTELSEWSNELGGGDKYKTAPDFLNWNPAVVEHVLQGYFGGMATTLNQLGKTMAAGVESAIDGEKSDDLTWRNTPVLSRFINDASDERSAFRGINEKYYQLYDVYKEVDKNLHGYSKEVSSGNLDYLDKLNGLYQSEEYKTYEIFKRSKNKIDRLRKLESELSDAMGDAKDKLQSEIKKLKKEIVGKVK